MPTDPQLEAFVSALKEHGNSAERRAAISAATTVTPSMVSYWISGKYTPDPEQVFAIEDACGLPAGTLSRHLGYVPVDASSVLGAIGSDSTLTPKDRRALETLYLVLASDEPS